MASTLEKLLETKRGTIGKLRIRKCISNCNTLEKVAGKPIERVLPDLGEMRKLSEKI